MENIIKELKKYINQNYEKPKKDFTFSFFKIKAIFSSDNEECDEIDVYVEKPPSNGFSPMFILSEILFNKAKTISSFALISL